MKKRDRIATVFNALIRANAGIATPEMLAREIEAGVTGRVRVREANALVEKGKWTQEIVDEGVRLGLIVEDFRRRAGNRGGGTRGGNVQNSFSQRHPEVYNGREACTSAADELFREWVSTYGVKNAIRNLKAVLSEYGQLLGVYFPSENSKRGQAARSQEQPAATA